MTAASENISDADFRAIFMSTGIPQRIASGGDVKPAHWHEFANAVAKHVSLSLRAEHEEMRTALRLIAAFGPIQSDEAWTIVIATARAAARGAARGMG